MSDQMEAKEFVDKILSHADPNYDPIARREYYLRTRQLKGRKSGPAPIAKTKTKVAKSPVSKTATERIVANLEAWNKRQAALIKRKLEKIDRDTKSKIDALPKIKEWLSPETKVRLAEAHRQEVAKIRGDAVQAKSDVKNWAMANRNRKIKQVKELLKKTERDLQKRSKSKTA